MSHRSLRKSQVQHKKEQYHLTVLFFASLVGKSIRSNAFRVFCLCSLFWHVFQCFGADSHLWMFFFYFSGPLTWQLCGCPSTFSDTVTKLTIMDTSGAFSISAVYPSKVGRTETLFVSGILSMRFIFLEGFKGLKLFVVYQLLRFYFGKKQPERATNPKRNLNARK